MKNFNNDYMDVNEHDIHEVVTETTTKHTNKKILKTLGLLCCMVAVSIGSIGTYKYYAENDGTSTNNGSSLTATTTSSSNNSNDSVLNIGSSDATNTLTPAQIYSKVAPSVVGITATTETAVDYSSYGIYGFGGNNGSDTQTQTSTATGTGIIMSQDGYILTNAHVVEGATSVSVTLSDDDNTEYTATIIGQDSSSDIAVLKIQASGLTPAEFGNSDDLVVGDYSYVIGNPLGFDLSNTFTTGIISGLNRTITVNDTEMNLIQTSAQINSGNSGGPLINSNGQVVGIVSSKMSSSYSSSEASIEGLGFAIPITDAKNIVDSLITYGYVTGRPQLGISVETISQTMADYYGVQTGAYIRFMNSDGSAVQAGLKVGDIITGIDDTTITSANELSSAIKNYSAGDTVTITYYRNNQKYTTKVTLQEQQATTTDTNSAE